MTERPMQKPQDSKVKNQPTKIAGAEVKREDRDDKYQPKRSETELGNVKVEEKQEEKKEEKKEITKKTEAIVNGRDLGISKKHSMAICDLIRGKNPEDMMKELELIASMKKPLRMKGEIPHRKGKIMSGRYPVNACKVFINLLKSLNANASVNGLENPVIATAKADDASRPFKRGGSMRFKRTNVLLVAKERINKVKEKKSENKEENKGEKKWQQ